MVNEYITPEQRSADRVYDDDKTQWEIVWDYLRRGHTLTAAEAVQYWNFHRLSDIIYQIRGKEWYKESNFSLRTKMVPKKKRPGKYGIYYLVQEDTNGEL